MRSLNGITLKNSGSGFLVPFLVAVLPPTKTSLVQREFFGAWFQITTHHGREVMETET